MDNVNSTRAKLVSLFTVLFFCLQCSTLTAQIIVVNTNDTGAGSLRNAIDLANSNPGPDNIFFNIPGSADQIILVGATTGLELPTLTDPGTVIDGSTQNGFGINGDQSPKIILDGSAHNWDAPINAVFIQGNDCAIYALEIRNFPDDGIDVQNADNVIIGSPGRGNIIYNNGWDLDVFPNANPPNSGPWEGCGIVIREGSNNCIVERNIIGTNENLVLGLGNEYCGILVRSASANQIRNSNLIIGNATGIRIDNSVNNFITQNRLFCNDTSGVFLANGGNNNIQAPVITSATINAVTGTAQVGALIELYVSDSSVCPSAACQGSTLIGQSSVNVSNWTISAPFANGITLNGGESITAIVTDNTGNSSTFASCYTVTGNACSGSSTLTVDNTNDEGPGSLRAAIECANANLGPNQIEFNIPGTGPHIIRVGETSSLPLPALLDEATILDATTQPGFGVVDFRPQIILDGDFYAWTAPHNAIWVRGDNCEIYGFEIRNFPDDAIDLTLADTCIIGDVNKGNVIYANGWDLDFFPGAPNSGPWNGCAIVLKSNAENCLIRGNILGTDYDQNNVEGNEYCGIIISDGGDDNIIGGYLPGEANIIANNEIAVRISNNSDRCAVLQNEIYCNSFDAILMSANANGALQAPVIAAATTISVQGTATGVGSVDVYIQDDQSCAGGPCQGRVFLGSATVSNDSWQLTAPFENSVILQGGETLTAIHISQSNSSDYAACFTISIPCALSASVTNNNPANCNLDNGSATINVTGGTGALQYDIGNGPTSNNVFSGLAAGMYTVQVLDGNSCSGSVAFTIAQQGTPQIILANVNNASCGVNNASFSVNVSGGQAPYSYDIGNGPQSQNNFNNLAPGNYSIQVSDANTCSTSVSLQISDLGEPAITVVNTINETCGNGDGRISLSASGGSSPYFFDIGNGPTLSTNFTNLSQGTYSVTVSDGTGCTAVESIALTNTGMNPQSNFLLQLGSSTDTYVFTNISNGGTSYLWDFGDGTTSNAASPPNHVFAADGDYTICLTATNSCNTDVQCQTVSVIVPLADVNIQGLVQNELGVSILGVELSCTSSSSQTTAGDGSFDFGGLTAGNSYVVEPHKDINHSNGVNVFDVFRIQQHILFIDTLDSPYKIIAADVNKSGSVNISDITFIRQLILLYINAFPNNESWRFVPESYQFIDPLNPLVENFPEELSYSSLMNNSLGQDFTAIKVGDVTLDANPAMAPVQNLQLQVNSENDNEGEVIYYFRSSNFNELSALQTTLQFEEGLIFEELVPGELTGFGAVEIRELEVGKLGMIWYDEGGSDNGISISSDQPLFGLKFKKSKNNINNSIQFDNALIPSLVFDPNGISRGINLENETGIVSLNDATSNIVFYQNYPNPFSSITHIPFELDKNAEVQIELMDLNGRILQTFHREFPTGEHQFTLDASTLNAKGIYFYRISTNESSKTFKMILQ